MSQSTNQSIKIFKEPSDVVSLVKLQTHSDSYDKSLKRRRPNIGGISLSVAPRD